jgi:hypothetical protein
MAFDMGAGMTHEELLAKINKTDPFNDETCAAALRAVVELTKDHADRGEYADGYRAAMKDVVKVIEKELG